MGIAAGIVVLGVCIEITQGFVPYRTASASDAVANAVGSPVAVLGFYLNETEFGRSNDCAHGV